MKSTHTKHPGGANWKTILLLMLMALLLMMMLGIWLWYDRQINQINQKAGISGRATPETITAGHLHIKQPAKILL